MITVSQPLGIPVSPILAPEMDITGQLRVDDPSVDTPAGLGDNVFKDRGAIDRADFLGPSAELISPRDNDPEGVDQNPALGIVQVNDPRVRSFEIQLSDGLNETQRQGGSGVDPDTVMASRVTVLSNGVALTEGVDYRFSYDRTSRIIRLTPLAGVWPAGRVYQILLDNSATGIRDLADNQLQANEVSGKTQFTVTIGGEKQDFGDAPLPYPTVLLNGGASHVIEAGFHLGQTVDEEPDGIPTVNADGDGADEDGVTFLDPVVPGLSSRVQVRASQTGRLDAWMDFNHDGDWSDAGEKIFNSVVLQAGVNSLQIVVPQATNRGTSYTRFRLSRDGNLSPDGLALNGEVEDYRVEIVSQTPWHNADSPLDVNDDNLVVAFDVLLVINELNNPQASDPVTGLLPNPPVPPDVPETMGYFDVDGDGYVSPLDALLIINELNQTKRRRARGRSRRGSRGGHRLAAPTASRGRRTAADPEHAGRRRPGNAGRHVRRWARRGRTVGPARCRLRLGATTRATDGGRLGNAGWLGRGMISVCRMNRRTAGWMTWRWNCRPCQEVWSVWTTWMSRTRLSRKTVTLCTGNGQNPAVKRFAPRGFRSYWRRDSVSCVQVAERLPDAYGSENRDSPQLNTRINKS